MTIYLDTPLKQLYLAKLISVRTFKNLVLANLYTVGDLIDYASPREKLLGLKHFGLKSFLEVNTLMDLVNPHQEGPGELPAEAEYSNLGSLFQKSLVFCYNNVVKSNDKIATFFKSLFPDAESLHNWLSSKSIIPLIQNDSFTEQENVALRELLLSYLESAIYRLDKLHLRKDLIFQIYQKQKAYLEKQLQSSTNKVVEFRAARDVVVKTVEFKAERDEDTVDMNAIYENLRAAASGRTQHFLSRVAPSYQDLIPYMDKDIAAYRVLNNGYPVTKTLMEVYEINQQLKAAYKLTQKSEEAVMAASFIADEFPFLNDKERSFAENFMQEHGYYPMFYILYRYLCDSDKRKDAIYSLRYGIKDGTFHPVNELAERFSIHPEYVRVLLSQHPEVYQTNVADSCKWVNYQSLFNLAYIIEETPEVGQLLQEENLELSFSIFSRLLALAGEITQSVDDRGINRQRAKANWVFKVFTLDDRQLVVNHLQLPSFEVEKVYRALKKTVQKKFSTDTEIKLRSVLRGIPDDQESAAFELLLCLARTFLQLDVSDQGICVVHRNCLDIAAVMCDILRKANHTMTLSEIFFDFKQRFPDHAFHDPEQLRSYMQRCDSICPIAKSGYYGLRTWDHVFFGSMQDYLFHHLSQVDEPMPLSELTALAVQNYPETYEQSVRSTMDLDVQKRFVQFQNGYYGLSGKQYDQRFVEKSFSIHSFDERLAEFKAFVEHHKRYPFYAKCDSEAALNRWFYRVTNDLIQVTDTQKQAFTDCLRQYEAKLIPRNRVEYRFQMNCDKYKAFIRKEGYAPSHLDRDLYGWMMRAQNGYPSFTDYRRVYFADLLAYIRSLDLVE